MQGEEGVGRAAHRCHGSEQSTAKKFEFRSKTPAGDTLPRLRPLTRCRGRICWLGSAHVGAVVS